MRELLYGILVGSLAGAFLPIGREWLDELRFSPAQRVLGILTNHRAPIVAAMLALLALVLPSFYYKSVLLFRSWRAGMVRGVSLVWALSAFCFWMKRDHWPLFLVAGVIFQILTEVAENRRKPQRYTAKEIAEWVPRSSRSSVSAIAFDKPIDGWDQDAVGRQDFVETVLARVLIDCEPAIGITADFGEGKSSVLHLVRQSIERGGKVIAVPFRTWLPSSEKAFVDSLFGTATAAVRAKFFLPAWHSTLRRYSRVVLGVVPRSWSFLADLLPPDSQFSQIEELAKLASKLPVRVVFLLDEIDRMHAEELTVLLKVLRGAPELANVSYVCAFSKDAVARVVSPKDVTFGLRYLEKFFPVQLQLPAIDEDLRECLFSDRIDAILQRERALRTADSRKRFDDARKDLWHHTIKRRISNFRLLGQILRAFDTSFHVLSREVDAFDLLVIECVRLLLPRTYEFVYQNGQYFHASARVMERWSSDVTAIDEQARTKAIAVAFNAYFETIPKHDKDLSLNLLSLIFPSVRSYTRDNSLASPLIWDHSEERRISDPDFFPRYFIYDVPATMFGEGDMDNFIELVRGADQGQIASAVEATYPRAERDDLRRIDFLRKLKRRAREIPDQQAEWLAIYLAEHTSEMRSEHIAYIVTKSLVLTLANRFQGSPRLQELLHKVVLKTDSDRFASDITYSCVSARDNADEISNWTRFDPEQIKAAFGERMRSRHPKPVANLQLSSEDVMAFSRWKVYVPTDVPYITEYFRSAFDTDIRNLGVFLQSLLPGNVSYEGSPIKFIDSFYFPVSEVIKRLNDAQETGVQWSAEHEAAIARFRNYLKNEPVESPPSSAD